MDEQTINTASKYVKSFFEQREVQLTDEQCRTISEIAIEFTVMFPPFGIDTFLDAIYAMYLQSQPRPQVLIE